MRPAAPARLRVPPGPGLSEAALRARPRAGSPHLAPALVNQTCSSHGPCNDHTVSRLAERSQLPGTSLPDTPASLSAGVAPTGWHCMPSPFRRVSPGGPPCWPGQGQEESGRGRQEAEPRCWGGVGPRKVWLSEPSGVPAPRGSGRGEVCGDPAPQPPGPPAPRQCRRRELESQKGQFLLGRRPKWGWSSTGCPTLTLPAPAPRHQWALGLSFPSVK